MAATLKVPDLTAEAASLRKAVWRELSGLRAAVSNDGKTVPTKSKGVTRKVAAAKGLKPKRERVN